MELPKEIFQVFGHSYSVLANQFVIDHVSAAVCLNPDLRFAIQVNGQIMAFRESNEIHINDTVELLKDIIKATVVRGTGRRLNFRDHLGALLTQIEAVCQDLSEKVDSPEAFARHKFDFDAKADILLNHAIDVDGSYKRKKKA